MMHVEAGEHEQAKALLEPLLSWKRLHFAEFAALCGAQIELLLAEGKRDGARAWFAMWERTCPDHPSLEQFRSRVQGPRWLRGLAGGR
jgi:hypothetical protein